MKNIATYYNQNLYYTTYALSREVTSVAENAFMDLGLTPSDAFLIMCVNEKPNIQPTEISERILLAPSTITRMIEKLEKRSIVRRTQEGKYTYVTATPKGVELHDSVLKKWDEINAVYAAALGEGEIEKLAASAEAAALRLRG